MGWLIGNSKDKLSLHNHFELICAYEYCFCNKKYVTQKCCVLQVTNIFDLYSHPFIYYPIRECRRISISLTKRSWLFQMRIIYLHHPSDLSQKRKLKENIFPSNNGIIGGNL